MLFFEAHASGGQIGGVDQSDRTLPPGVRLDQRLEQMLVDAPQSGDAQATAELVQHAHAGHLALAAQAGKLSPGPLLRQPFDQKVQRMDRREQTQQMHPIKLSGGVGSTPPARRSGGPALIDEIIGNEWSQLIEEFGGAGGRQIGVHGRQPTDCILTRQRPSSLPAFLSVLRWLQFSYRNFRNTLYDVRMTILSSKS